MLVSPPASRGLLHLMIEVGWLPIGYSYLHKSDLYE